MHGELAVTKYMNLSLDCRDQIKDHEQEFEKFYFVSMVSNDRSSISYCTYYYYLEIHQSGHFNRSYLNKSSTQLHCNPLWTIYRSLVQSRLGTAYLQCHQQGQ